ncbi:Oxidoreductase ptaL [Cladobotryum mycophilum]|uniref:Oxidoreductase ptaL n=1 Tax=Cladobotryum mycophilum TaxID=491253 RepID=A0ABR0SM13_9HYPO
MKTIVVLGAGIAATPLIRQIMKTTVLTSNEYKMVVVAPNTHFLWPIAMPRVVVPGQLADDKVLIALEPLFKEYPADRFEFVLGAASALEPERNSVTVSLNDGGSRTIPYHTIVVATGSSAKDNMPWKTINDTQQTKDRLHGLQKEIENAKTIVVAGGGLTGTETAGELGFEYSKQGRKEVYFIYNDSLPLAPPVLESVRKSSLSELEKLKVKLIPNTTVTSVSTSGRDTILQLRIKDGTTRSLTAQVYLPTTGVIPNSSFVPANMLDVDGYIVTTTFLQAKGYSNIFVLGDVGNLEPNKAALADYQTVHLIKALPIHLKGGELPEYQLNKKDFAALTIGRSRGTGHMGSFKLFSFLIYYLKGRFLGTDKAPNIAAGKQTLMTVYEK